MGGMVLETNMNEILTRIEEQNKLEKQEVRGFKFAVHEIERRLEFISFELRWPSIAFSYQAICNHKRI